MCRCHTRPVHAIGRCGVGIRPSWRPGRLYQRGTQQRLARMTSEEEGSSSANLYQSCLLLYLLDLGSFQDAESEAHALRGCTSVAWFVYNLWTFHSERVIYSESREGGRGLTLGDSCRTNSFFATHTSHDLCLVERDVDITLVRSNSRLSRSGLQIRRRRLYRRI